MNILILGATSPIARAVAQEYASHGHEIYLASRQAERAAEVAADIALRQNVRVGSGAFDATDMDAHADFIAHVEQTFGPIDVMLVAFGEMGEQDASQRDAQAARHVIDVNYTGAASICEAMAAAMIPRQRGAIMGISSVAGERGRQSNYIYGSAKGAFTLYLQGLRNRLHAHGIHVLTAKLGFVDTPMTDGLKTKLPIASPESVGRALYKAEQRQVNVLYYPRFWAGIMGIIRVIPEPVFKRLKL